MARLATADRFRISVSSMPGPWTQITGQEIAREIPKLKEYAGGPDVPMANRIVYPDVTLMRVYDSDRDGPLFKRIARGELFTGTSITIQELDADGNAIPSAAKTYIDCVLKSATSPDADANSEEAADLTVVFTVGGVAA